MSCNRRRLRRGQAANAIYIDFEGRGIEGRGIEGRGIEGEPPVLVGILTEDGVRQYVFDAACAEVDQSAGGDCEYLPIRQALDSLIEFSDAEQRHFVSWSTHDCTILKELTDNRAFRWRNAIPVARRWRRLQEEAGLIVPDPQADNGLHRYEQLIDYNRPNEDHAVGQSIAYIRSRSSVTPGSINRWRTILRHNERDLRAMQAVVHRALGLD